MQEPTLVAAHQRPLRLQERLHALERRPPRRRKRRKVPLTTQRSHRLLEPVTDEALLHRASQVVRRWRRPNQQPRHRSPSPRYASQRIQPLQPHIASRNAQRPRVPTRKPLQSLRMIAVVHIVDEFVWALSQRASPSPRRNPKSVARTRGSSVYGRDHILPRLAIGFHILGATGVDNRKM